VRLTDRGWFVLAVIGGVLFGAFVLPHIPAIWWG
jgi:hypothetical protein